MQRHRSSIPGRRAVVASFVLIGGVVAAVGPVTGQSDEPTSIAFIGESSATDAIWSFAVGQMRDEADTLGVDFVDRFAEGDYAEQARMIDEEVARGVDGIIAPFFDPQSANEAIRRALEADVSIYALLGVPALEPDELARIGTNQASWDEYGRVLADITLPQVEGDVKVLWPGEFPAATYISGAVAGFEARAAELGRTVEVEVLDTGVDPTTAASRQLAYLVANPDTDAIVTTGSIAIAAAATAMRQGNIPAGAPVLAGFVTNAQGYQAVVDGYMQQGIWPALDEDSRQAVRDVVAMATEGATPENRVQQYVLVDASNLDEHIPESLRS